MNGILNVLKPAGMTSHDVVNFIRRLTGQKKAGHTGTLDPGAAGVLPVCLGKATRIIEYLYDNKSYRAEATLGISTTTQDAFGKVIHRSSWDNIDLTYIQGCLSSFTGKIEQIPPMTSAIKHQGKKLYELARAGIDVEREPRTVYIDKIKIVHYYPGKINCPPRIIFDVGCSAGTYIRTLCNDLGEKLGCGAFMSYLLRTRAGVFSINETLTLEELVELKDNGRLESVLVSMSSALSHLPVAVVQNSDIKLVSCGNRLRLPVNSFNCKPTADLRVRIESNAGLLAIGAISVPTDSPEHYLLQPVKVLV
ncbi:tRNA pseudouridine synthase B [Desulfotomaculum arcticum]|uniref:tRNA pseudouridine synthase B n=1 Tax=Desulfotruncus arcticus DSM 17038 TaxID=1121424 RepID=A0A1I2SCS6_9FIRM|nr:tRNA pseudouridine(55) synthase TruB [Desulfotruncus arcticus]SFG49509.1 tRNA pseudouridine synthase B [Desulfotomaculum arcticum] [Desulfotruncus arcticus DSM 17038]